MTEKTQLINTKDLCKHYLLGKDPVPVLHDISFSVNHGDYIAIMGQSGSGKTTLLNILGCLDRPSKGSYEFKGRDTASLSDNALADIRNHDIGFVFQNFNLLPKLTVAGNVELVLFYKNMPKRTRTRLVREVLEELGLWERRNHRPNELSGGQKQRVAIARALVKKPSLILADEPTGNLDSHTTQEILALFSRLHENGNTILLITHEHDVAAQAGSVIELVDGRIRS